MQILSLIKMEIHLSTVSHSRGRKETRLLLSELVTLMQVRANPSPSQVGTQVLH